jgi:hypothetical protein
MAQTNEVPNTSLSSSIRGRAELKHVMVFFSLGNSRLGRHLEAMSGDSE